MHGWVIPLFLQHEAVVRNHLQLCRCLHAFKLQAANPSTKLALHSWLSQALKMLQVKAGQFLCCRNSE